MNQKEWLLESNSSQLLKPENAKPLKNQANRLLTPTKDRKENTFDNQQTCYLEKTSKLAAEKICLKYLYKQVYVKQKRAATGPASKMNFLNKLATL